MTRCIVKGMNLVKGFGPVRKNPILIALFVVLILSSTGSAQNIRLRGQIDPLPGNLAYADIYAEGNIAVIGTYSSRGALIVDITNPDAPVLASHYNPSVPSPTVNATQQMLEALVHNGIGYFGSGNGGGVHIVDLSNPYSPVPISRITAAVGGGYNTIHEIVLDGNYLYETDSRTNVVKVINVSNPAAPTFVRNIVTTDPVFIHAIHVRNGRMFTSGWGGKTDIYDITNVGTQAPPLLGVVQSGGNSHSNWISDDGNYLYNARELVNGDLRVYNISNPAAPTLVRSINAASFGLNAICPHNPVVVGNLLFVAWYQAGLQVFDITNPADPVRVGQFDTFAPAFSRSDALERGMNEPWDMLCATSDDFLRDSSLPTSYNGNWAVYPFLGLDRVLLGDLAGGLYIVDASDVMSAPRNEIADFDGDGKTDLSQFRASTGSWYIEQSSDSTTIVQPFGLSTDTLVPGDYDGDGKTDIAVYRPSEGTWYLLQSFAGFRAQQFGTSTDIPVPGDFDSDGRTDIAVWRPSNGTWYVAQSTLGFMARQWGSLNDKPVVGDYDGDGKTDLGVFRPSNGTWYIQQSTSSIMLARNFGLSSDIPLIGDFDGDTRSDFTVYRPSQGTWYTLRSSNGSFFAQQFGIDGDTPVPADYDGDGRADLAVVRGATASWYLLKSSNGSFEAKQFGESGDRPVPSVYYPQ